MITQDFTEYPEHRVGFYKMLRAINQLCFPGLLPPLRNNLVLFFSAALLSIPSPQFKLFIDSITWAFKHTLRDIADLGLYSTLLTTCSSKAI